MHSFINSIFSENNLTHAQVGKNTRRPLVSLNTITNENILVTGSQD